MLIVKKTKELTAADRKAIEVLLKANFTPSKIAKSLGVHKTTICREVTKRSTPNGYNAWSAEIDYEIKKRKRGKESILSNTKYRNYVIDRLVDGWSPEQICGRLRKVDKLFKICPETIYNFIYTDKYCKEEKISGYLRRGKRRRTKQNSRSTKKSKIPNRVSIHKRPIEVETRKDFGHWEGDSVVYANRKAINTIVERKTGIVKLKRLEQRTAELTAKAMIENLMIYSESKTLTLDNGLEFTKHEEITKEIGVKVYFADPYSSWQRGSNENTNMLLRGYLPKKANIDNLTEEELRDIEDELNNRPRKRLDYLTPTEAYQLEQTNILFKVAITTRM